MAMYAAATAPSPVQKRIVRVWSNDGPGLSRQLRNTVGYRAIENRIRQYVPASSLASMLFPHGENYQVVASAARGLVQHDAKTWLIRDGHFVELEKRTRQSIRAERKIRAWLGRFSQEDLLRYTDILFNILYDTGAETFPELTGLGKDALKMIRAAMRSLPARDRRWIRHFLTLLAVTAARIK